MVRVFRAVLTLAISLVIISVCIAQEYKEKNTGVIITKDVQGNFLNPKLIYNSTFQLLVLSLSAYRAVRPHQVSASCSFPTRRSPYR